MSKRKFEDEIFEKFRNSYSYKVAKDVGNSAKQLGNDIGNVINSVSDEVHRSVNNGKRAVNTQQYGRVTYNGSGQNPPRGVNPNNYNFDPNTGKPINRAPVTPPPVAKPKQKKGFNWPKRPWVVLGLIAFAEVPFGEFLSVAVGLGVGFGGYYLGKYVVELLKKKKAQKEEDEEFERLKEKKRREQELENMGKEAERAEARARQEAEEARVRAETTVKQTGNPEIDKVIDEGNRYIIALREANAEIPGEGISMSIDRIENACLNIFEYIRDNPTKPPEIKKFMNYYLPTTLKLLNHYKKLDSQTVKGETIASTMFAIEGMMVTIATAFEKKLDQLFESDSMDIQADIEVFENILAQEGLTDADNNITLTL
ncbi:MAG: 5-bromo-4-chloroindolyl phosphate hydrolysis family protein [Clostridia bacterium]|nr:5-bromo-4-chloroindolyl phosphate hydrolysis family protein [Clostridia bacterium]